MAAEVYARIGAKHRSTTRHVSGGDRWNPCSGTQGRPKTGPSPVDRRKPGSKHHVITDAGGIPLAVALTGGNRHDVTQLLPLVDKIPPTDQGHPRPSPTTTAADLRRPRLRLRQVPPRVASQGHHPGHRRRPPDTAQDSAPDAGSSSRPSPCCTGFAVCASAGRSATTSTKPSLPSPAPSSAGADSNTQRVRSS